MTRRLVLTSVLLSLAMTQADAGLVAHLPFNGDLLDVSGNGNHGTFVGEAAAPFVEGFDGTVMGAVQFDGVNDYVQLTHASGLPIANAPDFTVAMWVKGDLQNDRRVFSEGSSTSNNPLFNIGTHNTALTATTFARSVAMFIRNDASTTVVNQVRSLREVFTPATWHHIAIITQGSRITIFVDGAFDSTFTYTRPNLTVNRTAIGGILRAAAGSFFAGGIDDVRIYDNALDDAAVRSLVPNPAGCPADGDTHCMSLAVASAPIGGGPGWYDVAVTSLDDSMDAILHDTIVTTNGQLVSRSGLLATSTLRVFVPIGTTIVKVIADDSVSCLDVADDSSCELEIIAVDNPTPTCISHWTLDGDLLDSGPGGNHGAFVGAAGATFVPGFDGNPTGAVQLDGVDDLINCAQVSSLPIHPNQAYTVSMWVKGAPQTDRRVFSESSSTNTTPLINLGTDNTGATGKLDVFIRPGATLLNHIKSDRIAFDSTWHHIAFVDVNGLTTIYIDGIRDAVRPAYAKATAALDRFTIGGIRRATDSSWFAGCVDDVRVYNYALPEPEIVAMVPEPLDCVADADTHCDGLDIAGPAGSVAGAYTLTATAEDVSGDTPLFYTFLVTSGAGTEVQIGPQSSSSAMINLLVGTYTVSVTVDDRLLCRDVAIDATCTREIEIFSAPAVRISQWSFDGDLLDAEASANHGTFVGEAEPRFGFGYDCTDPGAVVFDGVDDYVVLSQTAGLPLYNAATFSIVLWVKGMPQVDKRIWSESNTAGINNTLYNLGTDNTGATGALDFFLRDDNGTAFAQHLKSTATVFDGTWHHVAWVDRAGDVTLYVDGAADATNFDYTRPTLTLTASTIGGILRLTAGSFFTGSIDEAAIYNFPLSQSQVTALFGTGAEPLCCPDLGDTHCFGLNVVPTAEGTAGIHQVMASAQDDSMDPISYTFTASNGIDPPTVVGPQAGSSADLNLSPGVWQVAVLVDDDPLCPDAAIDASCAVEITVLACPVAGDTHCVGLVVEGPMGSFPGDYTLTASAVDDSGDTSLLYTFSADNGVDAPTVVGPQAESSATVALGAGTWTLSVSADDDLACPDLAVDPSCSQGLEVSEPGGLQVPGDCNQDGALDISDGVCAFGVLFTGVPSVFPCGSGLPSDPGSIALMDFNASGGAIDISDGISLLLFLFNNGQPHPLAVPGQELTGCVRILGCPDNDDCVNP